MTQNQEVRIPVSSAALELQATLTIPRNAWGIVLFAHGSGSGRNSPRNRQVALSFQGIGLGTLLLDLLSREEEQIDNVTAELRFDLPFLSDRLESGLLWLSQQPETRHVPVGLFGSSTGAAAALLVAARRPDQVSALVSRGGRPDLVQSTLSRVASPTLLIVGEHDFQVLDLNRKAQHGLRAVNALEIVPGATHLFEEPGALEEVAHLARNWYQRFLINHPVVFA